MNETQNLKAVIIETSFPNELQDLANVSGHLTPQTLDMELRKLKRDVPVYLYDAKPRHLARIRAQVRALQAAQAQLPHAGEDVSVRLRPSAG